MQLRHIISGLVLLAILLGVSGCTSAPASPAAPQSTAPAAVQTSAGPAPAAPAAGADLVPSPTDELIDAKKVNINVEKDYLGDVTVTFQGGNGLQQVNKIEFTLFRADGSRETVAVGNRVGDSATIPGTKIADKGDRAVVYVTMKDGKTYKVIDTLVQYRTR